MDEISKNALFNIFKNQNEGALRSPTPSHLLNRSGNSAFRAPLPGSTPVNHSISLIPRTEHLLLSQSFHNNYVEETFSSSTSPSLVYLPHSRNLGQSFTESASSTIILGNSLQNPLSFNSFQPNISPTTGTLGSLYEKMENQQKHPIRPLPMRISPKLHYEFEPFSVDSSVIQPNDDYSTKNIDSTSLIKDNSQDEEINMVTLRNKDLKSINNQHDFELFDKGKQVIQESQSNQIEQASEDSNCLELIKWHLKIVPIKNISIPEMPEGIIPEGIDFWVVLSGIVNGTRAKWHSSAVIAREHNRLVQTAKDRSYLLIGKLLAKKMRADGFSEGLIKAFEEGFPENWQELLLAELESLNDEISFSFKKSHIRKRYSLRGDDPSYEKCGNSNEESTPRKKRRSSLCEELNNSSEMTPPVEETIEIDPPIEEAIFNSEINPPIEPIEDPPIEETTFNAETNLPVEAEIIPPIEETTFNAEMSPPNEETTFNAEMSPPNEETTFNAEMSPPTEETIFNAKISPPLEKQTASHQESKSSYNNKRRSKKQAINKNEKIVTSSGRSVRAPGNWWEVNAEPSVKEEIVEPKRRKSVGKRISSSTEKRTPSSATVKHTSPSKTVKKKRYYDGRRSRKRRSLQKGNATGNTGHEEETVKATVEVPRHEVYVLVETDKSR